MPPRDPEAIAQRNGPPSTSDEIRNRMRSNSAGRDTAPELAIRRILWETGVRYRVGSRIELPGRRAVRPDLCWRGLRLAVFVDGCYWHCCPDCDRTPKSNLDYWGPKLEANRRRDVEQTAALEEMGWTVLRFWEHESPVAVAVAVAFTLGYLARA